MTTKTGRHTHGLPRTSPIRTRSPFRDFHNRPRGGVHADRRLIRERIVRAELRQARYPFEDAE